mmetsp:Transcript_29608/g.45224  ORF Transcript_29608/g.45224 Transcript_29608/m.45224 type:complete len:259 (+) Transcript_29608:250-1026(+)
MQSIKPLIIAALNSSRFSILLARCYCNRRCHHLLCTTAATCTSRCLLIKIFRMIAQRILNGIRNLICQVRMFLQILRRIELPLRKVLILETIPAPLPHDNAQLQRRIYHTPHAINAFSEQYIQSHNLEGCSHLILHHLDLGTDAGIVGQDFLPSDIEPNGRIKLEGHASRCHLGTAINDSNLGTELIDENDGALGHGKAAGNFSHGLAHEPSLQSNLLVAHVTLQFSPGHQSGHTVYNNYIHSRRPHQLIDNIQGHFS